MREKVFICELGWVARIGCDTWRETLEKTLLRFQL